MSRVLQRVAAISATAVVTMVIAACQPAAPASPTAKPAEPAKPAAASPAAASPVAAVPSPGAQPVASPAASPAASPSAGGAAPPLVQIVARDFAFDAPETIAAGWTTIELRNQGAEPHHVQFVRLNDGVTLEQFQAALAQGEGPAMALVSLDGGVGQLGNGGSAEVVVNLRPGQFLLLCFVPSPDGVPHLAKGMVKPVRVAAAPAVAVPVAPPQTAGSISMKDFSFDLPATMAAGRQTYRVVNDGPQQLHETNILKLSDGKTVTDITNFFKGPAGPPPFAPAGGMQGLSVKGEGFMVTQLQPGNYAAVCMIPDPASGRSHLELGMIKEFTVR